MRDLEKMNNQELLYLIEKQKRVILVAKTMIDLILIELQSRNYYSPQEALEEKQKIK